MMNNSKTDDTDDEQQKQTIAAIYARVSSGKQVKGYSLNEQIKLCRQRCKQNGWKVRFIFRENGVNASSIHRPKFDVMMRQARQKRFDIIVFWKLDRFARSLHDTVTVEKKLREWGIDICSLTESIDTSTSSGRFVFRTLASASEWERDMISERSRMGMQALATQHKWPNRIVPLGYNKDEQGYLHINKTEAKIVKKIFKMYLKLKSMPQVAYELNQKNITTKNGKEWNKRYIKNILDTELYIGKYNVAGIEAYVKEYAIIREKTFKQSKELRYRYRTVNEPMPASRKESVVNKMFNAYVSYLDDVDECLLHTKRNKKNGRELV